MNKFTAPTKDRLRLLCANLLLYLHPPEGGYHRPSAIRFKRDGSVQGYVMSGAKRIWRNLAGMKAEGPSAADRWEF